MSSKEDMTDRTPLEERIVAVLKKTDHLKTPDNPEGNLFLPGNLSIEEAKQSIHQLITDEVLGVLEEVKAKILFETAIMSNELVVGVADVRSAITKIEERWKSNDH